MAAMKFTSTLSDDGSLTVPESVVQRLGIHPGDEVQVGLELANERCGHAPSSRLSQAVFAMTQRSPEQIATAQARAMKMYQPLRQAPAGKALADVVSGQWPGDETNEQIEVALRELS